MRSPDAEDPFPRLVDAFADEPDVTSGTMMASVGLKVRGKIFAMFVKGALVVKLPKPRVEDLVAAGVGRPFETAPGRVMKEWVAVPSDRERGLALAREAFAFVDRQTPLAGVRKPRSRR